MAAAAALDAAGLNAAAATAAGRGTPTSPSTLRKEVARAGMGIRMMRGQAACELQRPRPRGAAVRAAQEGAPAPQSIAGRDEGDGAAARLPQGRDAVGVRHFQRRGWT